MTFIKSHAEALREYRPIYVGAHRVRGLELLSERTHRLNEGTGLGAAREYLFRRFGVAPGLVKALKANPCPIGTRIDVVDEERKAEQDCRRRGSGDDFG